MSTKIYDGFQLKPGTNLFLLKKEFQAKYSEKLKQRTRHAFLEEMIAQYDRYHTKGFIYEVDGKPVNFSTPETAFADLRSEISSTLLNISRLVNSSEPWKSAIEQRVPHSVRNFYSEQQGAITIGQHENGTLLGLMHAHQDYREVVESLTSFQEWLPYWDNTDKPDELSDEQWSARELLWEETFNLSRAAKSTGILIPGSDWYDSYIDLSWKKFTDEDWDEEKITLRRAKDICLEEWVESKTQGWDLQDKISRIMGVISDYSKVDHTERLAQITENLTPLTLTTVTGDWDKK